MRAIKWKPASGHEDIFLFSPVVRSGNNPKERKELNETLAGDRPIKDPNFTSSPSLEQKLAFRNLIGMQLFPIRLHSRFDTGISICRQLTCSGEPANPSGKCPDRRFTADPAGVKRELREKSRRIHQTPREPNSFTAEREDHQITDTSFPNAALRGGV